MPARHSFVFAVTALAWLTAGCTHTNLVRAEVPVGSAFDLGCFESTLRSERDVTAFRPMSHEGQAFWFQLADPALMDDALPAFLVRQIETADGWLLEIGCNLRAKDGNAEQLRQGVLTRQREMATRLVDACGNAGVVFSQAEPCSVGDSRTLCVSGEIQPK